MFKLVWTCQSIIEWWCNLEILFDPIAKSVTITKLQEYFCTCLAFLQNTVQYKQFRTCWNLFGLAKDDEILKFLFGTDTKDGAI